MEELKDVINTLNHVSVQGEANLYYLLGAIQTLNKIVSEANKEEDNG